MIVRGAAGTGKTSIMKAVANYIASSKTQESKLMAPTGRAAKNVAQKTDYDASTLHSYLYTIDMDLETAVMRKAEQIGSSSILVKY